MQFRATGLAKPCFLPVLHLSGLCALGDIPRPVDSICWKDELDTGEQAEEQAADAAHF